MTYPDLQQAIADFLNREDLAPVIPTFIRLAEAKIARDVRHWRMERRVNASFTSALEELPDDWIETIRLQVGGRPMELASREEIARWRVGATPGRPRFFAHTDGHIELLPAPSSAMDGELLYFARVPALSDAAPGNWLLTEAPDVYLYGALLHSAPYLSDDERATVWGALYGAAVQNLNRASNAARFSGPMRLRA